MTLKEQISRTHNEIAGSRSKNRLTIQISYAMQLIMEFYSVDYLVMMDYIEDVAIICDPDSTSAIHLYQVKTKRSGKSYTLSTVIREEWYQKLYSNAKKYDKYLASASVTCNTDVVDKNSNVFPNEKTLLTDASIETNITKIKQAIANDQETDIDEVDLSKFRFIRSTLTVEDHKDQAEHKFQKFLLEKEPQLQVAVSQSIYKLLYEELDSKFNNEIDEDCTDIEEIIDKKAVSGDKIRDLISCGLAVQLPNLEKLFMDFGISSVPEMRKYSSAYAQIKMDMFSNMSSFIQLKKSIQELIEESESVGLSTMQDILERVLLEVRTRNTISAVFDEGSYLEILTMVLIYKYCH